MKTGHWWVMIILILSLIICNACISQGSSSGSTNSGSTGGSSSSSSSSSTTTTTVPVPKIIAGANVPGRVNFGQFFNLGIIVFNTGNGPAQNVHLYCRANPGGLIAVQSVDQPSSPLAPSGVNVTLGDMYPGNQRNVNFTLRAPTQQQIGGTYGQNFEIDFAADYYGGPQSPVGSITFSVGQGMMMMVPHGFDR